MEPTKIITEINWVDILVISLLFRAYYISFKNGIYTEIFKTLGTLTAVYLSLHYYARLADFVFNDLSFQAIPVEFLDFLSFILLAGLGYLFFMLLREAFLRFLKMQVGSQINRWVGLVIGGLRSLLLVSLVLYALAISSLGYLNKSVGNSFLGRRLFQIAPATYTWMWDAVLSKFSAGEQLNGNVKETGDNLGS